MSDKELQESPLLEQLQDALDSGETESARQIASHLDEDEAFELLEDLSSTELDALHDTLGDEVLGDLLTLLHETDAADVLEKLPVEDAADILEELDPDDATDIFSRVEPEFSLGILNSMEPSEAAELQELLRFPPDTAGGIMTPAFVAVFPDMRADETVSGLRKVAEEKETVNYVYVVDREGKLEGVLSLHSLVLSRPETPVRELLWPDIISVYADEDQEIAARKLTDRHLLALPVVDRDNVLLGIITADDVADILEDEATEDITKLGGSQPLDVPYMRASPLLLFRKRIVWLLVLFFAQFITISIQQHYGSILDQLTILAFFVPILIGTGGNVGSQTVSTIIRAMALGELQSRFVFRIIGKELLTGLSLGVVMGALMYGRALMLGDGSSDIALVVGITVLALCAWAATIGAILPIVLSRLRVDPAVVSAPFISSLVDGTGLIFYFSLAQALLHIS